MAERRSSKGPKRSVAVFGAGIAGLTVAHELALRGHTVSVYEANSVAGGFFRSARMASDGNMPSEYSWHGFGGWYHNVYAIMQEIATDDGTVYDRALSRPIDFGVASDDGVTVFDDTLVVNVKRMFRMTWWDLVRWMWLMLETWTAGQRSEQEYARVNAAEAFRRILSKRAWMTWRASFGPWIGSDWTNVSLHQCGSFFRKHLMLRPSHWHPGDEKGGEWIQRSRTGWLLLRGPSNEVWFDPWVAFLESKGVRFHWRTVLEGMDMEDRRIARAWTSAGEDVVADLYVLAIDPFATAALVERTPAFEEVGELRQFRPLVQDGPHVQVSFRIAFGEEIRWPRERAAVVVADSEFNLTLFAQEQVWRRDEELGDGVAALWTGTACVANIPGRLFGKPLKRCTMEEFVAEVRAQLEGCAGLDALVREANGGRSWTSFPIVRIEVWHEWLFSPDGISGSAPKWVNTTHTQPYLPSQRTPIPNLLLAGAHTRTDADVWSIEAAAESGRRAAQVVEPDVEVIPAYVPWPLRALRAIDDRLYAAGAPHVLEVVVLGGALTLIVAWMLRPTRAGRRADSRLRGRLVPWATAT